MSHNQRKREYGDLTAMQLQHKHADAVGKLRVYEETFALRKAEVEQKMSIVHAKSGNPSNLEELGNFLHRDFLASYSRYDEYKYKCAEMRSRIEDTKAKMNTPMFQADLAAALAEEDMKRRLEADNNMLLNAAAQKVNALASAAGQSVEEYILIKAPPDTFPWSSYQVMSPELGSIYHVPKNPTVEYETRSCTMPEERLAIALAEATRSDGSHVFAVCCTIKETFSVNIRNGGYREWEETRIEYRIVAEQDIRL